MAQDPLQIDALQVNGDATAGTRLVESDATDGSLKLSDARVPSGINLHLLPGLQQVDRIYLVGTGGLGLSKDSAGTAFTSIQSALDAIPATHTATNPVVILVAPGLYTENLTVEKDGIEIRGLGRVTIRNSGVADTLTVTTGVGIPLGLKLRDLRIENTEDGRVAVLLDGAIGSTIGSEIIDIERCELVATGVGGFALDANIVNNVRVSDVNCAGGNATSIIRSRQVASLELRRVNNAARLILDYDSGGDIPSVGGSVNAIENCEFAADLLLDLSGVGSLASRDNQYDDVVVNGDRPMVFRNDAMGDLTVNESVAVQRIDGSRGTLAGSATATVEERSFRGEASFVAAVTVAVAFDVPMPDTDYTVSLDSDLAPTAFTAIPGVTSKLTSGFSITFGAAQTTVVRWAVTRNF